jgi:hypothetical protein
VGLAQKRHRVALAGQSSGKMAKLTRKIGVEEQKPHSPAILNSSAMLYCIQLQD